MSQPGQVQDPKVTTDKVSEKVSDKVGEKVADEVAVVETPSAPAVKRFLNGWTRELENLFAEWADKASCYRWMHEKTGRMYHSRDQSIMFPIIILSTVGGAANFAMNSISQDPLVQRYIQLGLGGLSMGTAILTTIANRLAYGSAAEAHRGASISWGKFNRLIVIELSLHPDERMDAFAFMKMFRVELDRLIEQSPSIPESIINKFVFEFKESIDIKKPDITGDLEHTRVFSDSNTRLKKIAEDAAMNLHLKKGILKQLVLDDLDSKIRKVIREITHKSKSNSNSNTPASFTGSTTTSTYPVSKQSPNAKDSVVSKVASSTLPAIRVTSGSTIPEDTIVLRIETPKQQEI
jgi:hypothetical protein